MVANERLSELLDEINHGQGDGVLSSQKAIAVGVVIRMNQGLMHSVILRLEQSTPGPQPFHVH